MNVKCRRPRMIRRWPVRVPKRRLHRRNARRPAMSAGPYFKAEGLLTRGELAFYHVLRQSLSPKYSLSLKTRLADIVRCPDSLWTTPYGRKLSQKHVDFVLYDPHTANILAVIELDDRTHDQPERQRRDQFLTETLLSVAVPLLRIRAAHQYNPDDLRHRIGQLLARRHCVRSVV